jgi:hypothetical protein
MKSAYFQKGVAGALEGDFHPSMAVRRNINTCCSRIQRRKASQAQFPMSPGSSPASEHHPTEAPTKIKPQASSLPAGFNKASQEYADANSKHIDRFGLLRYAHSLNTSLSILHGLEVSFDTTLHKALLWSLIMSLRDDFKNDLTFNNRPGEHVSCPPNKKAQIIPTAGISIPFTDPADEKDSGPYEEEGHASLAGDEADAEWHERTCVDAESPLYRTPESLEDFEIYSTYSQQRQEFEECCELAAFRL